MKKSDLERRYHYLLLQMKIINELVATKYQNTEELCSMLGAIEYHSDKETINKHIKFIEGYNEKYNFFKKTMSAQDYIEAMNNN